MTDTSKLIAKIFLEAQDLRENSYSSENHGYGVTLRQAAKEACIKYMEIDLELVIYSLLYVGWNDIGEWAEEQMS